MNYGYELILDANKCSNINRNSLKLFVTKLCKAIDMKRYGKCQVVLFGKGDIRGYSIFQFITTSSIVGHFRGDEAYLNIFSCKEFDKQTIIEFVKQWFSTNNVKYKFLRR